MNSDTGKTLTVIRSDTRHHKGYFGSVMDLFNEICLYRNQIWSVYKRNFRNSYYGTGLGVVWNFILPLVPLTCISVSDQSFPRFRRCRPSNLCRFWRYNLVCANRVCASAYEYCCVSDERGNENLYPTFFIYSFRIR